MQRKSRTKQIAIYLGLLLLFLLTANFNHINAAAELYFNASTTTVHPGNTFTIFPTVSTGGDSTNAYTAEISFPSELVEPIDISKGGSICTIFTQNPFYTTSTATITCGLPTPGYNGSGGVLGNITFRAKSVGTATIYFNNSSRVLANDGYGTNILEARKSITLNITEPPPPPVNAPIVSASLGQDGDWVSSSEIIFNWTTPANVIGFSYLLTENQNAQIGYTSMGSHTTATFTDLDDGVYYFKIVSTNGTNWSNPSIYTLRIDTSPPDTLEIVSDPTNEGTITKLPLISFNATDSISGIAYYEIKIDDGDFAKTESPYQIKAVTSGQHTVTIKAVDHAGNILEKSIILQIDGPKPPIITTLRPSLVIGSKQIIEGITEPNSTVTLFLNGKEIAKVLADQNGHFVYIYNKFLLPRKYRLFAVSENDGGILGANSEVHEFTVYANAIEIGSLVIPTVYLIVASLFIILLLVVIAVCLRRRYRRYKARVLGYWGGTKKKVAEEFDELEQDVKTKLHEAKQGKGKKDFEVLESVILKEIAEAESDINRKIKSSKQKSTKDEVL